VSHTHQKKHLIKKYVFNNIEGKRKKTLIIQSKDRKMIEMLFQTLFII